MKHKTIAALFLLTASLCGQNLVKNGDFDKPLDSECRFDAAPGVHKASILTENLTWNKCLKLEVVKYQTDKNGRKFYTQIMIGGDKKNNGFPVKPNTVYNFSLELKGNAAAFVSATEWTGPDYWKNMRRIKKISGQTSFKGSDEWTVIQGSFQTGADAVHAVIGVSIWGEERYKNLPPVGSFLLIDKVRIEEKADLLANLKTPAKTESVPLKKVVVCGVPAGNFTDYRSNQKAKADTEVLAEAGQHSIKLKILCHEPEMGKLHCSATENGGSVWKDDTVEFFFRRFPGIVL